MAATPSHWRRAFSTICAVIPGKVTPVDRSDLIISPPLEASSLALPAKRPRLDNRFRWATTPENANGIAGARYVNVQAICPTPVALVTGGSRGIGRGICLALAGRGYAIAVNYAANEEAARTTLQLVAEEAQKSQVECAEPMLCQGDIGV